MKKIAIITGATSGIGRATAILLAKNGYDLILTGRRIEKLHELQKEVTENSHIDSIILNFDIRNRQETEKQIASLPAQWKNIDLLINNAGLAAGYDPIQSGDIEDWEMMIDTNLKGLLYMSHEIIPLMIARKRGHIVNISSLAGKEAYPNGNVYCATKAGVEFLTKGMRIDLLKHNIKVSSIAPGMVNTEFSTVRFHGDAQRADNVYNGLVPLVAEDIADTILFIVTRPAHVCISDISIMPTAQATATINHRKE